MRTKFRAWDSRTEEMTDDITLYSNGWIGCVFPSGHEEKYDPECDHIHVMQWTGLNDSKGVPIYEGDILDGSYVNPMSKEIIKKHYKVAFRKATYYAELIGKHPYGTTSLYFVNEKSEVIGNVHQNPELINS